MAAARSSIYTSIFSPATCSQRPRFVVGRRAAAPSDVKDNQQRKAARGVAGGEKNIKIKIKRQRAAFDKRMKVCVLLRRRRRRVTQADVGGGGSGGG